MKRAVVDLREERRQDVGTLSVSWRVGNGLFAVCPAMHVRQWRPAAEVRADCSSAERTKTTAVVHQRSGNELRRKTCETRSHWWHLKVERDRDPSEHLTVCLSVCMSSLRARRCRRVSAVNRSLATDVRGLRTVHLLTLIRRHFMIADNVTDLYRNVTDAACNYPVVYKSRDLSSWPSGWYTC